MKEATSEVGREGERGREEKVWGDALMHAIFGFHSQQSQYNLWAEGSGG